MCFRIEINFLFYFILKLYFEKYFLEFYLKYIVFVGRVEEEIVDNRRLIYVLCYIIKVLFILYNK